MSTATPHADRASGDDRTQLRRAVIASAVGTAIEWYDFFLYGVAAALVFPAKFFPSSDPYTGTLLSLSTFFVGFASRPIGAAIFGHFGDRVGRKASLIATLLLMGLATAGIGLVPGYDQIGIWGGVCLIIGRALQGIAVGGEWGGSVLLAAEWAKQGQRGLAASWPQFGAPCGLVLANGGAFLISQYIGKPAFVDWGWRLPFVASVVLVAVGLWIRIGILEPPVFERMRREGTLERAPVLRVLATHWREVVLTALLRTGQQTPFYIFCVFILTYATTSLGLSQDLALKLVLIQAATSMVTIPLFGYLSDRVGRKRLVTIGALVMLGWSFAYFELLDTREMPWIMVAIIAALPIHDMQYGPQAALIAESFPANVRYSGASLGYQLASITAGGPAPFVAVYLMKQYGSSLAIAIYMAICVVVSLVALSLLRDHSAREL